MKRNRKRKKRDKRKYVIKRKEVMKLTKRKISPMKLKPSQQDQKAAKSYFAKFSADLPKLISELEGGSR